MPEFILDLAATAAAHYRRRAQRAADSVRLGQWTRVDVDRVLAPWRAMAVLAGADLGGQLTEALADYVTKRPDDTFLVSEGHARTLVANAICPREVWQRELTAACHRVARGGDPAKPDADEDLFVLADALGLAVPAMQPLRAVA